MKRHLRIRPEAEAELANAAEWYERKRPGLGAELVAIVDRAIDEIAEAPDLHPLWRDGRPYRKFVLRRFPYVVFYKVTDESIDILAVAHAKRRPGYWSPRAR